MNIKQSVLKNLYYQGYPHLEEAYQFAELVFPLLDYKQDKQASGAPKGEVVGYQYTTDRN